MEIQVIPLPQAAPSLLGETVVVIDALRMTTVAATAKENGCLALLPVGDVAEALARKGQMGALLGGERNALPIPGFDLSNSPLSYTRERVAGRRIIITTTNGTRAILAAQGAERILLGAFVNAGAVAKAVSGTKRLTLLLAGTNGAFTLEDALCAGAILHRLDGDSPDLCDMGIAALSLYRGAAGDLHGALSNTRHYGRLKSLGLLEDLHYCLQEDILSAVPERGEGGQYG